MIERDHIMRMVNLLAQAIARVVLLRKAREFPQAIQELDRASRSLLGADREILRRLGPTDLQALLCLEADLAGSRLYVGGRLVREEAELARLSGTHAEASQSNAKALHLFLAAHGLADDAIRRECRTAIDELLLVVPPSVIPPESLSLLQAYRAHRPSRENTMDHRARVLTTLHHRTPDRVAVDFGSTAVTGIHVTCVEQLRRHYGLERRPVRVSEPYQMLGEVEPDLLDALGIDTAPLPPHKTMFGFPNEGWREYRLPWGQEVLVPRDFQTTADANGDLLIYPEGDRSAPPRGRMPAGGFFFDTIVLQEPIDDDRLNPEDNLEEFAPLSDADLAYLRARATALADSPRCRVATFGGTAFGDIALVPAPWLKHPRGIRDIAEWYMSTATRRDYVHAIFSRQTEIALANLERIRATVGDAVDVVFVCGTDFGTQSSSFCSPATFDQLYAPYYTRVNEWIHRHTPWKTFKHSCGAVKGFIEHFIACGFDILNPVQCSAAHMEPAHLKKRYGERIVFWGGGTDTQQTLPFGTPADVRREVLDRCAIFAPGGGFVFNAVHNIQAGTPLENIVAMVDAVREFNGSLR